MIATQASNGPGDVCSYISEVLAQLADLAGDVGSDRLERSLRLLALEAAADAATRAGGRRPASRQN